MRLIWFIVKANDSTRVPRMNALMKMRLRRCLCICMALLLVSCASAPPKETYLTSNSLSSIKKVAILASANALDVTPATQEGTGAAGLGLAIAVLAPLLILPYVAIGTAAERAHTDSASAKEIGTKIDISSIEDKIVQAFTTPIRKASCFDRVDYIKNKINDDHQLSDAGYNAVIRLVIKNISLTHLAGDNFGLQIHVQGQLTYLRSGKIVWDREEVLSSPEVHTLNYYKENGLKELDAIIEKAGQNLAYDFVYLK
ncbi:hypothetical protein ISS37_11240 [candidate division KSB1 bacterium]|nr:hypothetical protein [candidate division KSB1 bacterium]